MLPHPHATTPTCNTHTFFSLYKYVRMYSWMTSSINHVSWLCCDFGTRWRQCTVRSFTNYRFFSVPLQSTSSSSSSSLPFLPELQGGAPDYSQYTDHTSLLSSLSVTAEEKFKGQRRLNELLLSENVPVKVEGPNKSGLSEKVGVFV